MVSIEEILEFATTSGCVTSKHLMARFEIPDNRQINRSLAKLTQAGYLERSGSIRNEGPGKPIPLYTATRSGFAKAAVRPREVSSLTALTRSVLLSELVSKNKRKSFSISIEVKDQIFNSFGLEYPHRDKWYAGNLVYAGNSKPHVFVPFTDYQAAVRMCKEPDRRENKAVYHIVVDSGIAEKVRLLTAEHINPFGIYGVERDLNDWSALGRKIINSGNDSKLKDLAIVEVKRAIDYLRNNLGERLTLDQSVYIHAYETGFIFTE